MTLGWRLNHVLGALLLQQEASAVDYSRDHVSQGSGGHGAHGDPSRKPTGSSRPAVVQWAERFERLIEVAEQEAGLRPIEERRPGDLSRRIHEYEGYDPVFVAFAERASVETVRRIRRDKGLDVSNGNRLEPRARSITAPPRDGLKLLADVVGGEL